MSDSGSRVAAHRQFFAEFVTANVPSPQPALVEAFRTTPREAFLGPGPWYAFTGSKSVSIPTDDPAFVYQDVVIRLKGDINNGQPSLHAMCLGALKVQPGETAIHIGAGLGYYTAILAQLVGPHGRVHAYEVDLELAARASQNLKPFPQVTVHAESAVGIELPQADVVYVNAGASHVPPNWLDALKVGGRLLFPLEPASSPGAMLLVTHTGEDQYPARFIVPAIFIPCVGAQDEARAADLGEALRRGDARNVKSLRRDSAPDETAWHVGDGWWLSTAPASSD
jgi:protein-L-isoaspartate(D-aspartate) O-methyltransferase